MPPADLFDMVIVDEAHHLPSRTWRAVLDHIGARYQLLLTATPFRLDRKPVPGKRAYYFPLRQAIADGFYKPIRPIVLPRPQPFDIQARDAVIAAEVVRLLASPEHATSSLMVRARTRARAGQLADRYRAMGVAIEVLTSQLSEVNQTRLIRRLQNGELRAVAVVGMLGEGFDLPRLRVVAYHDKHKSMPATVQLIGRLARVSEEFPQESALVTADDANVYPELVGVVRDLYKEDADWATLLPGLVDEEVLADASARAFVEALQEREGDIDPGDLRPMPRPIVYEIAEPAWRPLGATGEMPPSLHVGGALSGALVLFAVAAADGSLIALVTRRRGVPPWSDDPSLESIEYGLSVISYRPSPRTDLPSLLFMDAADTRLHQAMLDAIDAPATRRPVSSERLDGYMQSLPRISVSSIGMRNILAGTRGTSYKTRAGSSTDTDLLSTETTQTALGHVMMQIEVGSSSTTVGAAFEKGKLWQRRYKPFVDYAAWITEAAELLWFPRTGASADLLPQISRGRPLVAWPDVQPIAIEPNPAVAVGGYQLFDGGNLICSLEDFELFAGLDPTGSLTVPPHTSSELPVVGVIHDRAQQTSSVCWTGILRPNGTVQAQAGDLAIRRGYIGVGDLSAFLEHYPPLVYFLNGQAVQGHEVFDVSAGATPQYDPRSVLAHDWVGAGIDILAETRATAATAGRGLSIHEGSTETSATETGTQGPPTDPPTPSAADIPSAVAPEHSAEPDGWREAIEEASTDAQEEAESADHEDGARTALGVPTGLAGGAAAASILAAGVVATLRWRRRTLLQQRAPGMRLPTPLPETDTQVAKLDAAAVPEQTLDDLASLLASIPLDVHPVLVRITDDGQVTLLFDERGVLPDPPSPWTLADDGAAGPVGWQARIGDRGPERSFGLPLLVTLGRSGTSTVLANVGAMGTLALEGPPSDVRRRLRAVSLDLDTSRVSFPVEVAIAGDDRLASLDRVRQIDDPASEVEQALAEVGEVVIDDRIPRLLVCHHGSVPPEVPEELIGMVGVLAAGTVDAGAWLLDLDDEHTGRLRLPDGGTVRLALPDIDPDLLDDELARLDEPANLEPESPDGAAPAAVDPSTNGRLTHRSAPDTEPAWCEVRLLGPVEVARDGVRVEGLTPGTLEILVYLATHRHGVTKERLDDIIWAGSAARPGSQRVTSALTKLRKVLGDGPDGQPLVPRRSGDEPIVLSEHLGTDLDRAFAHLAVARDLPAELRTRDLTAALELVRGEPLEGRAYSWATDISQRAIVQLQDAALDQARGCRETGDLEAADRAIEQGLKLLDPNGLLYYERARLELLRGRPEQPPRIFEIYRRKLADDADEIAGTVATPPPEIELAFRELMVRA